MDRHKALEECDKYIRIFKYICHKYLFVSIFSIQIYSDIRSCQICLDEYIRRFVLEYVKVWKLHEYSNIFEYLLNFWQKYFFVISFVSIVWYEYIRTFVRLNFWHEYIYSDIRLCHFSYERHTLLWKESHSYFWLTIPLADFRLKLWMHLSSVWPIIDWGMFDANMYKKCSNSLTFFAQICSLKYRG